jgi:hypothetical protein
MPTNSIKRRITFVAWASASEKRPFDLDEAISGLASVPPADQVFEHGEMLTAVDHVSSLTDNRPARLRLLALHDADNAPSEWGPGAGATHIKLAAGCYTAFFTHVVIWPDKIAAFDRYANAPGLGRLAAYIKEQTGERVIFRALYEQGLKQQLEDLSGYRSIEYGVHDPHKKIALAASGAIGSLLPRAWQMIPSIRVRVGMGRRGRRDAYLDDGLHDDVVAMSDAAEEFFDSLIISGPSKTRRTSSGGPQKIDVNLLSQRLQAEVDLPRDSVIPSLPKRSELFKAIRDVRREFDHSGKLEEAVEARIALDDAD